MSPDILDLSILKVLVTNKKHALDFVNTSDSKLFSPDVWNFANIICSYVKTYKDVPTLRVLTDKFNQGKNDKLVDNIKVIWNGLEKFEYNDKEYKYDLEKLKNRYAKKQIISIKDSFSKFESGEIDISKAIGEMQKTVQSIKSLNQTKIYDIKTLKDSVSEFREEYNAKLENPNFNSGIKTGYSYLDSSTNGLNFGEMLLICAESGVGKSMLLMNMAIQMWMQDNTIDMNESQFKPGNGVLYFSLEMPFKPCLNRALSRLSGTPSKLIKTAKLNPEEAVKLKKALRFINKFPSQFQIIDMPRGATIETIESIYEESKLHFDAKIVVIDYLGLMKSDSSGKEKDDWLVMNDISAACHEFSRVHNCIVLSAVQLNRAKGKDEEDRIGMHRIGRSGSIMNHANVAIQLDKRPKEISFTDIPYFLIKNRDGNLGKGSLIKNLSCAQLVDNPIESEVEFYDRNPDDIAEKLEILDDC